MTKNAFENILDKCCEQLTSEAQANTFKTSAQFENNEIDNQILRVTIKNGYSFSLRENRESKELTACKGN